MKKLFVKYSGKSASVVLNGANANPYRFFPTSPGRPIGWVEIHKNDEEYFLKRCERNAAWSLEIREVLPTQMKYSARFMGIGAKRKVEEKSTKITLFDNDIHGSKVVDSIREYEFPMKEWKEIKEQDKAFFKKKADANEHWEYEKKIVHASEKKAEPSLVEKVKAKLTKEEPKVEAPVEPPVEPQPTVEATE